ncbi:hypothetical protein HEB94_002336 [Actinopolymorpha pittospori]|uniref:Uncharacterized protein n=1 Tax=Actinopolymorpha pittospori TaxID=648752 RepID=A0A927MVC3_9ACTN|nr:hypothetical protein [Actinopolymorpha pittospori]
MRERVHACHPHEQMARDTEQTLPCIGADATFVGALTQ